MIRQKMKIIKVSIKFAFSIVLAFLLASHNSFAQSGFYAKFNGKQVTTQNISEINASTALTFEAQVYLNDLPNWTNILGQIDSSTNRVLLQMHQGKLYCIVANGSNTFKYTASPVLSVKKWHKIAMTYDSSATNNEINLYLDGQQLALNTGWKGAPSGQLPITTANFAVGHTNFNGMIDSVRVWDAVLPLNTINSWQDKAIDATHPYSPNLVLNWNFEDYSSSNQVVASGSTAYDGSVINLEYDRQFVGSYFPYYALGRISPASTQYLSHIFYFSLGVNLNGELGRVASDGTFTHINNISKIATDIALLNSWKQNYNTELFVTVGGWVQSDYLDEVLNSSTTRATVIANIKAFLLQYNLDGVDVDWEPYHGGVDVTDYDLFLDEMKTSFIGTGLKISATVNASAFEHAQAFEAHTDFVQLMSYGRVISGGTQYSLSKVQSDISGWETGGLNKEKVVVGLPAFSRPQIQSTPDSLMYSSIVDMYDPISSVDSVMHNGVAHYFNGLDTINMKTNYVKEEGLKGVMIWDQGQDVEPSHAKSILVKAADTIGINTTID